MVVEITRVCGTHKRILVILVVVPRRIKAHILHKFAADRADRLVIRVLQRPERLKRIQDRLIALAASEPITETAVSRFTGLSLTVPLT